MAFMAWNKNYSVGVEQLDQQHSGLFDLANELYTAMLNGQSHALTGEMLDKLVNYTEQHFAAEEALMEATNYPRLDAHRAAHRCLTEQVNEYRAQFERGEGVANLPLLYFFNNWLSKHILKEDKDYGPWLASASPRL